MLKSFLNVCKTQSKTLLYQWLITIGLAAVFLVMALVIIYNEATTYAPISSLFGFSTFIFVGVILGMQYFSSGFDFALKMGETRGRYLVSVMLFSVISNFVSLLILSVYPKLEEVIYNKLFPAVTLDPDFSSDLPVTELSPFLCLAISVIMLAITMFMGYIIAQCGRKGFLAVYLTACFSPMILSAVAGRYPAVMEFIAKLFISDAWYMPVVLMVTVLAVIAVMFPIMKKHSIKV